MERGSNRNKWDFHVHIPYSVLNNKFGFNPYNDTNKASFYEYIRSCFAKAIERDIVANGITDHFYAEGYKRIRKEYHSIANNVTGAGAEIIIIADKAEKECSDYKYRFEHKRATIENIRSIYEDDGRTVKKGILNHKGIQEQICDILEGGKDAFELRQHKYFSAD